MKKRRKKRPLFILSVIAYALIAVSSIWFLDNRVDEAVISLILLGFLPVIMTVWIYEAIRTGEMIRQGSESPMSSTFNSRLVTRKYHPVSFWTMIGLTVLLALAIVLFILAGIYSRLPDSDCLKTILFLNRRLEYYC